MACVNIELITLRLFVCLHQFLSDLHLKRNTVREDFKAKLFVSFFSFPLHGCLLRVLIYARCGGGEMYLRFWDVF